MAQQLLEVPHTLQAVDEFHAAHPTAAEAVFVTAESFEAGVPELVPADEDGA